MVAALRARVEQRRAHGDFPPGLEDDLDAHFRRVADHRPEFDLSRLQGAVDRLNSLPGLDARRITSDSSFPGGSAVHRSIARAVSRQTEGVLAQVAEVTTALAETVRALAEAVEHHSDQVHTDLLSQVDAVAQRLAALGRAPGDAPAAVADLHRRVAALEGAEARRRFRPPFPLAAFEEEFRGTPEALRARYADVAALFAGKGPVLDIGCGRGEMLELLREAGVEARGVELDVELAASAAAAGFDVQAGDGIEALGSVPDASLGGVVLLQVVEHLTPGQLCDVVALASEKLRPGGVLVAETVNPMSLYVFANSFYVDPTHHSPVHPAYMLFLARQASFATARIDWRTPLPEGVELERPGDTVGDANVEKLNNLLFSSQDYALIAER